MSLLTNFAAAAYTQAATIIGSESITLDGSTYAAVVAEVDDTKDFVDVGFENTKSVSIVMRSSLLPSTSLIKKPATVRGVSLRVDSVNRGAVFTTVRLVQPEKA